MRKLVAYPQKEEQTEIGRILKKVEDKAGVHSRNSRRSPIFCMLLHQLITVIFGSLTSTSTRLLPATGMEAA